MLTIFAFKTIDPSGRGNFLFVEEAEDDDGVTMLLRFPSVGDLARDARKRAWASQDSKRNSRVRLNALDGDIVVFHDVPTPLACIPFARNEQQIFMEIFCRSRSESEELRRQLETGGQ